MKNKTEKIIDHFIKRPEANVKEVAAKFGAAVPMVYRLRKQAHLTHEANKAFEEMLKMPEMPPLPTDLILDDRAQDYGKFRDSAALMQSIKRLMAEHAGKHNKTFADDQWEALEMIVHKMARIVNGNPDKVDTWRDIAGYATLIADRLEGNAR